VQGNRYDRAALLHRLPLHCEGITGRDDDISMLRIDIHVPGLAQGDNSRSDVVRFAESVEVTRPLTASMFAMPFVGRQVVNDGCQVGTSCQQRFRVALIEGVYELPQDRITSVFSEAATGSAANAARTAAANILYIVNPRGRECALVIGFG